MNQNWETFLNIETEGIDECLEDSHHFRYEPTPYAVLEQLLNSNYLNDCHHLVDMGCGKGRVSFFFAQTIGCQTTGIDFNQKLIDQALSNRVLFPQAHRTQFICMDAQKYEYTDEDTFYFFNPFSQQILARVLANIIDSWYDNPRTIRLCFYYIDDDILAYLMTINELIFLDEINCEELYDYEDELERIMIFETISWE